ncbi:hypothetical protein N0V91_008466 [Didymella pomorum]|uniref:Uncharacterized protein n=1 Tax=Didymella pomorum TaxID=749634 RepID=A0A9W9D4R4_9PLEO|nr:hypothetical protein N0V91_008466 [Didymella pomorum]
MKVSLAITALLSTLATALPTATILEPIDARTPVVLDTRDARAATIYKSGGVIGESTFVPANNYCTNISVIPGGFDGKIKSLSVEKGMKCDFYREEGCGVDDFTGGGMKLEVGSRKYKDVRRKLGSWEGKIASVYCQKL